MATLPVLPIHAKNFSRDFNSTWSSNLHERAKASIPRNEYRIAVSVSASTHHDSEKSQEHKLPPLVSALKASAEENVASFHFPGHNKGQAAPSSFTQLIGKQPYIHDLSELRGIGNLYSPDGALLEAQIMAAELFGASETWFLVGGTTCGIQAAIMATCSAGDHIILPRNSHISAVSGMVLSGAIPEFVLPDHNSDWDVAGGITPSQVESAIKDLKLRGGKTGAVLVVYPTYHGICSDITSIVEVCHAHGIPLIVDNAHGAHFGFHKLFPDSALSQGADIVIQSTHKVLCSLTQSSMLHKSGDLVNRDKIRQCLLRATPMDTIFAFHGGQFNAMQIQPYAILALWKLRTNTTEKLSETIGDALTLQSSSSSFLLLASLDAARAQISENRENVFDMAVELAVEAKTMIKGVPYVSVLEIESFPRFHAMDPLRITFGTNLLGLSGFEVDGFLTKEFGLFAELIGTQSITLPFNLGTRREHVFRLVSGLKRLAAITTGKTGKSIRDRENGFKLLAPFGNINMKLSPREAFFMDKRRVAIKECVGRISGELLCPYPPAIPTLIPGEVISQVAVDYLLEMKSKGATITGASDPTLSHLLVCDI